MLSKSILVYLNKNKKCFWECGFAQDLGRTEKNPFNQRPLHECSGFFTRIKETPGFKRIDPEYEKAVREYRERTPELMLRLAENGLELEDRYITVGKNIHLFP